MSCDCQFALVAASTVKVSSCAEPYWRPILPNWCCYQRLLHLKTRSALEEYPLAPRNWKAYCSGSTTVGVKQIASVTYNFAAIASYSSLTRWRLLRFGLKASHRPKRQKSLLHRLHLQSHLLTHYGSTADSIGTAVVIGGSYLISVELRYWVAS
jgi:hypothetical protein